MKITFAIGAADNSGGFRVIVTYAQLLQERGHDVFLVARPHRRPSLRSRLSALRKGQWIPLCSKPHASHLDGTSVPHRILDRFRPIESRDVPDADVIIATWWETMNWIQAMPASKGAKVHLVQGYETWGGNEEAVHACLAIPGRKIAISNWLGAMLRDQFNQKDVVVIPNAVEGALFHAAPREKGSPVTVGFIYARDYLKGSDIIIDAIVRARKSAPNLRVIAFGHTKPDNGFPTDIEFHVSPPQATLRQLYARCDAWLFGSRREGFGLPILEAMRCRTPVIATPAGAAPELIQNSGGGLLVGQEDSAGMASAILDLTALSSEEWRILSDKAHDFAVRQNWSQAGVQLEAAISSIPVSAS